MLCRARYEVAASYARRTGKAPQNLTEIDLHDVSYKVWDTLLKKQVSNLFGKEKYYKQQLEILFEIMLHVFREQMQTKVVRDMLADKSQHFDLVVVEAYLDQAIALAHIYRAPAILMSSSGIADETYEYLGTPIHPVLYPDCRLTQRYNISLWEIPRALYNCIEFHHMLNWFTEKNNVVIRDLFGMNMPPLEELRKNVVLQFVNWHPAWEGYRPLPFDVVHLGGMHLVPPKDLPTDLKSFLDSSEHGVIYTSFGNTADVNLLPTERLNVFARVFATLPYDVLWKGKDTPQKFSSNVHAFSWLPQGDLLHHQKVVLFITQGGLQSTDEALRAGVPLLGLPLLADQWINVENYVRLGVGMRLDLHTLSETQLREAIETLIHNKSYRERSARVGREMQDRAQSALARAVWGAERAMRLRGRRMTTPPSPLTCDDLIQALVLAALVVPVTLILVAIFFCKIFSYLKLKVVTTCRRVFHTASFRNPAMFYPEHPRTS